MHLSIFAIFSVGFNDVVLVVVSYLHTAGFLVEVLGVAEVLLAWFLRTNFKFGERGWGVVIVVGGDAWNNLQGRVVDGGSRLWRGAALKLGSVVFCRRVWRRGRAFCSWCRRRLGALVHRLIPHPSSCHLRWQRFGAGLMDDCRLRSRSWSSRRWCRRRRLSARRRLGRLLSCRRWLGCLRRLAFLGLLWS